MNIFLHLTVKCSDSACDQSIRDCCRIQPGSIMNKDQRSVSCIEAVGVVPKTKMQIHVQVDQHVKVLLSTPFFTY